MLIKPCIEISDEAEIQLQHRFFSERSKSISNPTCTCAAYDSMSEGESNQEPIESTLTPDEASRIIHSHRKVRYGELSPLCAWQIPISIFISPRPLCSSVYHPRAENLRRHRMLALSSKESEM
jgi:hypothetical protein